MDNFKQFLRDLSNVIHHGWIAEDSISSGRLEEQSSAMPQQNSNATTTFYRDSTPSAVTIT
jgi:hypothetical protein